MLLRYGDSQLVPTSSCRRFVPAAPATHPRLHHPSPLLLLIVASLLFFTGLSSTQVTCSAQQVRIPLTRKSVPDGVHYRSSRAMAAHAAVGFRGPVPDVHSAVELYSDPAVPVPLKNFYNRMYVGNVEIGTPSVTFSLVFDTGSADLWVFAAKSSKPILSYVTYYDYAQSSTSDLTTTPWSIQYGKGASSGVLVSDTVSLAGYNTTGFTFAQATSYSSDFESPDMPLDGLLGLAFSSVNSAGGPTLIDALQSQGRIKERVFSFYLTTDNPDGSEFVLGSPDLSLTRGNLTYLSLASNSGMWILSMQAVLFGGTTSSFCASASCPVLVDTGTSFIGMPSTAFNAFASAVESARSDCSLDSGSGLLRCNRATSAGLPSLGFSLQGSLFTVTGADYFQSGVIGVMSIDVSSSSSLWILGDTFLKTYYTVFDLDNRKIGIAGAKPGVPYSPPGTSREFTWQLVLLVVLIAIAVLCVCVAGVRAYQNRQSNRGARSPNGAPAPYMLHEQPYAGQGQRYQPQPVPMATMVPSQSFTGRPMQLSYAPGGGYPIPPMPTAPPPHAQSEFARDFYRSAEGQV